MTRPRTTRPRDEEPNELGRTGKLAAFATVVVGIFLFGAGAQLALFLTFRSEWMGWIPWMEVAAGLSLVWLGVQLAHPRAWAAPVAAGLLPGLGVGAAAWAIWLGSSGFFSPLLVLAPVAALAASVLVAVAFRELREVGRVRAAAELEFASYVKLDADVRRGNRWFLPVSYGVIGVPVAVVALAIFAPTAFEWIGTRARGALAGRSPFASGFVSAAEDYPYTGSPLAWYLAYEARFTAVPVDDVLAIADRIATNVGWRLSAETGIADPVAAEAALWAAGRERELPLWIAAELRTLALFYSPESLFSRSFDPDAHVLPDQVHLDCDQLVWMFLHVASRLDLAMSAVPSVMHVYLRYGGPDGQPPLYVETTEFRNRIVDDQRVDLLGPTVGASFWLEEGDYAAGKGGTWASPRLVTAAGLYEPWSERDIRDSIVANVLVGVEEAGLPIDAIAEAEAQLPGSRDITLIANLYRQYVLRAELAVNERRLADARAAAERARAIRAQFGPLVLTNEAKEDTILSSLENGG